MSDKNDQKPVKRRSRLDEDMDAFVKEESKKFPELDAQIDEELKRAFKIDFPGESFPPLTPRRSQKN